MITYQNNLTGELASTAMPGVTNFASGTFAIDSSNRLAETSSSDGHACLVVSIPPATNFDYYYTFLAADGTGGIAPFYRSDSTGANGYVIVWNATQTILFKRVASSFTSITVVSRTHTYAASDLVHVRLNVSGTTHQLKFWVNGNSEPGSYQYSFTDSTFQSSGYFGCYQTTVSNTFLPGKVTSFDSVVDTDLTTTSINPTNTNAYFSPYNWRTVGNNRIQTNNPGAYFKANFTGTSFSAIFDTARLVAILGATSNWPKLAVKIDNGAWQTIQINQPQMTLASSLSDTNHTIRCAIKLDVETYDRWTGPESAVRIIQFVVDTGKVISTPTVNIRKAIFYGDSITEGVYADAAAYLTGNNSTETYAFLLGDTISAEFGIVGFGATGYTVAGNGNVPALSTSWSKYDTNYSRLSGGLLLPAPDYIFINEGTNESGVLDATLTTAVTTRISELRTAAPNAKIFVIIPFNQTKASAITTGFNNAADSKSALLNLSSNGVTYSTTISTYSYDGLHPNAAGHIQLSTLLFSASGISLYSSNDKTYSETEALNFINGSSKYTLQEIANIYNGSPDHKYSFQEVLNLRAGRNQHAMTEQEALYNNLKTVLNLSGGEKKYSVQELLNLALNSSLSLATILG